MDPVTIAAIIAAVSALAGTAGTLAGDKGAPIDMASSDPQMDEYRRNLMALVMSRIGQNRPYAKPNTLNLAANNMASQYYTGQPYTHPGYGMGSSFAGLTGNDISGAGGQGGPPGGGLPQVPGAPGGMPPGMPGGMPGQNMGQGPRYGPQLQKGANFAR